MLQEKSKVRNLKSGSSTKIIEFKYIKKVQNAGHIGLVLLKKVILD